MTYMPTKVGQIAIDVQDLAHLLRLGLQANPREFGSLARKMVRQIRREHGDVASPLVDALSGPSVSASGFRTVGAQPHHTASNGNDLLLRSISTEHRVPPVLGKPLSEELDRIILEHNSREKLLEAGLSPIRTSLFVGPPGVGKTMTAGWLAKELDKPLYTLNLSAVTGSKLGQTGNNLRQAFQEAAAQDAVLLLDEFDSIARSRGEDDIGEAKRIVTVLLQEIDAWPDSALLLAATNHKESLDKAIWRRFDLILDFPFASRAGAKLAIKQIFQDKISDNLIELLGILMENRPYSEVAAFSKRVKKDAVLQDYQPEEALRKAISAGGHPGNVASPRELAKLMVELGFSQRQASEISGVSRDTIRKSMVGK